MTIGLITDGELGSSVRDKLNESIVIANDNTGWATYTDTQYVGATSFNILANTDTVLPNNAGSKIESQMPSDIVSMYDGTVITGRNGDGLGITLELAVIPTSSLATQVEVWLDIDGQVGELYRSIVSFPKGQGVVRKISDVILAYTLDTWETNGATVYVRSNGTCSIQDIRYVLHRTHKGR